MTELIICERQLPTAANKLRRRLLEGGWNRYQYTIVAEDIIERRCLKAYLKLAFWMTNVQFGCHPRTIVYCDFVFIWMFCWPGKRTLTFAQLTTPLTLEQSRARQEYHFSNKFKTLYSQYFQATEPEKKGTHQRSLERLKQAGIAILPKVNSTKAQEVTILKVERGGAVIVYQVRLGYLLMEITLLNVQGNNLSMGNALETGTFGRVVSTWAGGVSCLAKIISMRCTKIFFTSADGVSWTFKSRSKNIEEAVLEYAFNLVCSVLDIGPQVRLSPGFDLVCFDDEIQFLIERCDPVMDHLENSSLFALQKRLMQCVRTLHQLGLVHKDIKPSNIVFSPRLSNFVLIDFGVSLAVWEKPGFLTLCRREGTARFMSPEMKALKPDMIGRVDLFWNDAYGLRITVVQLARYLDMGYLSAPKNSDQAPPNRLSRAVQLAYAIYGLGLGDESRQLAKQNLSSEQKRSLSQLFPQFPQLWQGSSEATHTIPKTRKYNTIFLLCCMGLSSKLLALLKSSNDIESDFDNAVIKFIQRKQIQGEEGANYDTTGIEINNQMHRKETSFKKELQDPKTLLIQKADRAMEEGGLKSILTLLEELIDIEELQHKKQLYEWLFVALSGKWTPQTGPPPGLWRQSHAIFLGVAALHYWAGNLEKVVPFLTCLAEICGIPQQKQKTSFVDLIVSVLETGELDDNCYEVLLMMLMDHFSKSRNQVEMLRQAINLSKGGNVPRNVLAAIYYYQGNALKLFQFLGESLHALSKSLALLYEQPRTNQVQVAIVKMLTASNHYQLERFDVSAELLRDCSSTFRQQGSTFSEHHFQSVAMLASCYYKAEDYLKGGQTVDELRNLFRQHRTSSSWMFYRQNLCYYITLLYQRATFNGCVGSSSEMIAAETEVSLKCIDDTFPVTLEAVIERALHACVVCQRTKNIKALTRILAKTTRSLILRFSQQKIIEYDENQQTEILGSALTILQAREDLLSEFLSLSSTLVFRFLLLKEPELSDHFQTILRILKTRNDLSVAFRGSFSDLFFELVYVFVQEQDDASIRYILQLFPNNHNLMTTLGLCLSYKGDNNGSIQVFDNLIKTLPPNPKNAQMLAYAESNIGYSMIKLGMVAESKTRFRRAVQKSKELVSLFPENTTVKASIAKWLMELGEYEEALEWLKRIKHLWHHSTQVIPADTEKYSAATSCFIFLKRYRQGIWAATKTGIAERKSANTHKKTFMEDWSQFKACLCLCELKRFRELRRRYSKAVRQRATIYGSVPDNFLHAQELRVSLRKQSNVLAYSILGWGPLPGSNLHTFLKEGIVKQEKARKVKRVLQEAVTIKRILRLLVTDSVARRAPLQRRKLELLLEVQRE